MVNTQNRNDTKFKIFFCTLRCVKNLLWFLVCLLSIEGLFVENLLSWILQALFVFLLLPFLSNLKGIPFAELPAYLNRGAACFLNIGGNLKGKYISYFLVVYLQMVNKHCLIFCNFKSVVIGGKKNVFFSGIFEGWIISIFCLLSVIVRLCMSQEYIYNTMLSISNSKHFSPLVYHWLPVIYDARLFIKCFNFQIAMELLCYHYSTWLWT